MVLGHWVTERCVQWFGEVKASGDFVYNCGCLWKYWKKRGRRRRTAAAKHKDSGAAECDTHRQRVSEIAEGPPVTSTSQRNTDKLTMGEGDIREYAGEIRGIRAMNKDRWTCILKRTAMSELQQASSKVSVAATTATRILTSVH
jgi:hypothetical protein